MGRVWALRVVKLCCRPLENGSARPRAPVCERNPFHLGAAAPGQELGIGLDIVHQVEHLFGAEGQQQLFLDRVGMRIEGAKWGTCDSNE